MTHKNFLPEGNDDLWLGMSPNHWSALVGGCLRFEMIFESGGGDFDTGWKNVILNIRL